MTKIDMIAVIPGRRTAGETGIYNRENLPQSKGVAQNPGKYGYGFRAWRFAPPRNDEDNQVNRGDLSAIRKSR
jgi:hypothetical protein